MAARLAEYHELWRDAGPRVYISSYSRLHREFDAEVRRIAALIGCTVSNDDLCQIKEKTSLHTLRKEYEHEPRFEGKKFFRKGEIGDWKNYFTRRDGQMFHELAGNQLLAAGYATDARWFETLPDELCLTPNVWHARLAE